VSVHGSSVVSTLRPFKCRISYVQPLRRTVAPGGIVEPQQSDQSDHSPHSSSSSGVCVCDSSTSVWGRGSGVGGGGGVFLSENKPIHTDCNKQYEYDQYSHYKHRLHFKYTSMYPA
jgi:hypothetical protein